MYKNINYEHQCIHYVIITVYLFTPGVPIKLPPRPGQSPPSSPGQSPSTAQSPKHNNYIKSKYIVDLFIAFQQEPLFQADTDKFRLATRAL